MTKAELIKALEPYPDNMEVFIAPRITDFTYGLLNSVKLKEITFTENEYPSQEEVDEAPLSDVIILDEE